MRKQFCHDAEVEEMGATNERGHQISGHSGMWWDATRGDPDAAAHCPYGQPGDRLWVRETWAVLHAVDHLKPREIPQGAGMVYYAATENLGGLMKRPSIFMPRWASRITLEVTRVRVERLQDITRADAIAEGVEWNKCPTQQTQRSMDAQRAAHRIGMAAHYEAEIDYVGGYRWLWESINGPGSWAANPWVWVVEFTRVEK
jgi:hypothetical protein